MLKPFGYPVFVFNTAEGLNKDVAVRKAIRQALSMEDMMACGLRQPGLLFPRGAIYPEAYSWHTEAGTGRSLQCGGPGRRGGSAEVRGYNGEATGGFSPAANMNFHYKMAQVGGEYLKLAALPSIMQVVDWATLTQRGRSQALGRLYHHSPFLPEPALIGSLSTSSPGWWNTPARKAAVDAFTSEVDPKGVLRSSPMSKR